MKLWINPLPRVLKMTAILALLAISLPVFAQEAAPVADAVVAAAPATAPAIDPSAFSALRIGLDTVWVLVAGMLVFWMNAGFALVESGLCRSKNCVNILAKNFVVFALASTAFYVVGWDIMFGDGSAWFGRLAFFVQGADNSPALGHDYMSMNPFSTTEYSGVYSAINWTPVPLWAKFFFQLVFAGTAATIVSGAVAERIKFTSFIWFALILVAVIYPISGHWIWGGGILGSNNFRDFAGSTVVHSVGGWAALAGIIVLGPRLGKYKDGKVCPIPGHNMTSAALGVLILWLGWFGFNPGSTMAAMDGSAISYVLVNTNMGAVFGTIGATITAWVLLKKPDLSMILNGCLAGLVAITAPCAFVSIPSGCAIGFIAGVIAVLAVVVFDKLKLDDPVGALAVHLANGLFGTLALGLFYDNDVATSVAALPTGLSRAAQTLVQLKGMGLVALWVFPISLVVWYALKAMGGIRVKAEEEIEGLDIGEHGNEAYPDFTGAHK
jgi:Amt family ammonium transporter